MPVINTQLFNYILRKKGHVHLYIYNERQKKLVTASPSNGCKQNFPSRERNKIPRRCSL